MENDNSLLCACYINDMDLIKERIIGVTPSQLKKSTLETSTPIHTTAKNGNLGLINFLF